MEKIKIYAEKFSEDALNPKNHPFIMNEIFSNEDLTFSIIDNMLIKGELKK